MTVRCSINALFVFIFICISAHLQAGEFDQELGHALESNLKTQIISNELLSHIQNQIVTLHVEGRNYLGVIVAQGELIVIPTIIQQVESKKYDLVNLEGNEGRVRFAEILGTDRETQLTVLKFVESQKSKIKTENVRQLRPQIGAKLIRTLLDETEQFNVDMALLTRAAPFFNVGWHCPAWGAPLIFETEVQRLPQSWGPLFDIRGNPVSLSIAYEKKGPPYRAFSLSMDLVTKIAEQIRSYGKVQRGWIGLEIGKMTSDIRIAFNIKSEVGVIVTGVVKGGPAERAGMSPGDAILEFDGYPVESPVSLIDHINCTSPGQVAKLVIVSQGVSRDLFIEAQLKPNFASNVRPY